MERQAEDALQRLYARLLALRAKQVQCPFPSLPLLASRCA